MERYHIYKLGLAILFYAVYYTRQTVANGLKIDAVASTTNITGNRERRNARGDNPYFYQGSEGTPGVDFPTLSHVPRTVFSCKEMEAGYYADLETDCQVFHICDEGRKLSFLCPNGTIFQQSNLICDWWYKVNCTTSPSLYEESAEILQKESAKRKNQKQYPTKQGVFDNYSEEHDFYRSTPARFVTPSYASRNTIKDVSNQINNEGSTRRSYNERYDRKLETIGNGVRESTSDKNSRRFGGRVQNTYDKNFQQEADNRDNNKFSEKSRQQSSFTTASSRQESRFGIYESTSSPRREFDSKAQSAKQDNGINKKQILTTFGQRNYNSKQQTEIDNRKQTQTSTQFTRPAQNNFDAYPQSSNSNIQQTITDRRTPNNQLITKDNSQHKDEYVRIRTQNTGLNTNRKNTVTQETTNRNVYAQQQTVNKNDKVKFSISSQASPNESTGRENVIKQKDNNSYSFTSKPTNSYRSQEHVNQIPVKVISAEAQEPQESASFVTSSRNNVQTGSKSSTVNPYPNHRSTYSEIKDLRHYYEKPQSTRKLPEKPFFGSSVSPQILTTIPITNYEGKIRSTTSRIQYIPDLQTDLSSTRKPTTRFSSTVFQSTTGGDRLQSIRFSQDGTGIEFSTLKTPVTEDKSNFKTVSTISDIALTTLQPHKKQTAFASDLTLATSQLLNNQQNQSSSTIDINKVTVSSYDADDTSTLSDQLNTVSSTFRPNYDRYNKKASTPGNPESSVKSRTDSPILRVTVIKSEDRTTSKSNERAGKSIAGESPKTQIILLPKPNGRKKIQNQGVTPIITSTLPLDKSSLSKFNYNTLNDFASQNTFASILAPATLPTINQAKVTASLPISDDFKERFTVTTETPTYATTPDSRKDAEFTVYDSTLTTTPVGLQKDFETSTARLFKQDHTDTFTKPPGNIFQPKPFSKLTFNKFDTLNFPKVPPYTLSSASPFTTARISREKLKTAVPTLPTLLPTSSNYYPYNPTDENINNMINTLTQVVKQRLGGFDNSFSTPRPGLVVPPSVGPDTLHSLAVYFANTLENTNSTFSSVLSELVETPSPATHFENEELIKSLLTQMTALNYDNLFKDSTTTESTTTQNTDESENGLDTNEGKHLTEGPGVRQLARVFTEALSAYLEDPDTFKKVLHAVRPTDPPPLSVTETEEEEVLNYSDSDLKSDQPHLPIRPTGIPASPTWGYIIGYNKSTTNDLEIQNSINAENENLQIADSQSFVSQLNKVTQEYKTTTSEQATKTTTERGLTGQDDDDSTNSLPENHWTTSRDVAKLWQTTLLVNPADLNKNIGTDETVDFSVYDETLGIKSTSSNSEESPEDPNPTVSEIQYELRALPKLELNSTQVHGILIDFMNTTKSEGSGKLQRILYKLNITQEEFLDKMKEIEQNPLTRRLILLLISECSSNDRNKELETKTRTGGKSFSYSESKIKRDRSEKEITTELNYYKSVIHPSLNNEDEDTRALELLNSLYVIASKFGK